MAAPARVTRDALRHDRLIILTDAAIDGARMRPMIDHGHPPTSPAHHRSTRPKARA